MNNSTPSRPSSPATKKLISRQAVFIFLFGLVLGIAIFSSYHYYYLAKNNSANPSSDIPANEPATFAITDADHIWGAKDAAVTLAVFSDLSCPYCREYHAALEEFMKNRSDKVRIVWRHLPLSLNSVASVSSAIAAECAGEQDKFFEYLSALYPYQDEYGPDFYLSVGADLGLDKDQFSACAESGRFDDKIQANYSEAISLGVEGTPASFLNGRYLAGALTRSQLEALIDPLID